MFSSVFDRPPDWFTASDPVAEGRARWPFALGPGRRLESGDAADPQAGLTIRIPVQGGSEAEHPRAHALAEVALERELDDQDAVAILFDDYGELLVVKFAFEAQLPAVG